MPILLRQTSFKALEEPVMFAGEHKGTHSARFGEIEQRGVALTPKGRALYDRLLNEAGVGKDNLNHQRHLQEVFSEFPDSEFLLRQQGLAWFRYRLTPTGKRIAMLWPRRRSATADRAWLGSRAADCL